MSKKHEPEANEMSRRTREFDWSKTSVGTMEHWPQGLKTAVEIMLGSRYAMWIGWGKDFTFFYNDAYAKMTLGPKHPWALGRPASEVWSEIWGDVGPRAESVIHTGESTWDERLLLFLERQGFPEETYHTFSYSPLPSGEGSVGGMLCVVTEETERTIGERRLFTLRELAARAMDEAISGTEACHTAAKALEVNPYDLPFALVYLIEDDSRQATLAGLTGIEQSHLACPANIDLNSIDGPWPLSEVLAKGTAVEVEDLQYLFDGSTVGVWAESPKNALVLPLAKPGQTRLAGFLVAGISPRLAFDDNYRGFLELVAGQIATAIANARAYEEERRRARKLAELDKAKTAFFSNISHEFRTPLTLMLSPLEEILTQRADTLAPAVKNELEMVNRNGLRLLRLVNSLLDFSRIESGRVLAKFQPTNLASFTSELASVFRSAMERAGLKLIIDCPPLTHDVYVDHDMWEKIVLNLLSNALKFTFEGEISLQLTESDAFVTFSVHDTGTGIATDQVPKLFDRFHRVENARSRTHEGSGIGLALVQELIKIHGGAIAVRSELGVGTSFEVTLPKGVRHLPQDQIVEPVDALESSSIAATYTEEAARWLATDTAPVQRLEPPAQSGNLPPRTDNEANANVLRPHILVVDDNSDMREYIARLLSPDYFVTLAIDGEVALALIREKQPDLILTDVMMPRLDGFGLLKAIRNELATRELPVIMLSARAGEESRIDGIEAGADDYLTKPFSAKELLARVNTHLQLSKIRRESALAVQRSEATLRETLTAAQMTAWEWDLVTRRIVLSENSGTLFGLLPDATLEVIDDAFQLVHPDDLGSLKATLEDAISKRCEIQTQFRMVRPDTNDTLWIETHGQPVFNDSGETVKLVGLMTDVTLRKQAETALCRERDLLHITLSSIGDAVITTDIAARVTNMNNVAEVLTGWSLQEALGQPLDTVFNIVNEETRKTVDNPAIKALEKKAVVGLANHTILIQKDGGERPIDDSAAPIIDAAGDTVGCVLVFRDVSDRKRIEAALRQSEAQFRNMADHAPAMLWVTDPTGFCTFLSRGWYEYTGQTEAQGLGFGWLEAVHPEDRSNSGEVFVTANKNGVPFSLDHRVRTKSGEYRWAIDSGHPHFDDSGAFLGFIGSVFDVHERKQAEDFRLGQAKVLEMIATEQSLDAILSELVNLIERQIPTAFGSILLLDAQKKHLRHGAAPRLPNEYMRAIDGIEIGPNVGSCGTAIYLGQRVIVQNIAMDPLWTDFRDLALVHHLQSCWSEPIQSGDGSWVGTFAIYFQEPRSPTASELELLEAIARFAGLAIDRPRAQAALRTSEARFRSFTEATSDVIYRMNADWTELRQLEGGGYTDNFVNPLRDWMDIYVHPDDRALVIDAIAEAIATKSVFRLEHRVMQPDGGIGWVISRAIPIVDEDGNLIEWFGAATDVTPRKQAEDAQRHTAELLREADIRKNEFLATLAHELRNPLAPIRTGLELMKLMEHDSTKFYEVHATIERQMVQLITLVDDLLDLSRISQGKLQLRRSIVDVGAFIQNAVESSQPLINDAGHLLHLHLPDVPIFVSADLQRMTQVVSNLLNNAAKYTPDGGEIWLSAEHIDHEVIIRIRDSGIGIPSEKLDHIFEMFAQINHPIERTYTGLGIGLTLVRQLVDMHDGSVSVTSKGHYKGSEFIVRLPSLQTTPADAKTEKLPAPITASGLRIMVVDDNIPAANMLSELIELLGNQVAVTYDGLSAIELGATYLPDVILMDLGMPIMNGYDAAREIRGQIWGRDTVLIALTGWGQEEDRQRSADAGFDEHLVKPLEISVLNQVLNTCQKNMTKKTRE